MKSFKPTNTFLNGMAKCYSSDFLSSLHELKSLKSQLEIALDLENLFLTWLQHTCFMRRSWGDARIH